MSLSAFFIGYSQEMRNYILMALLAPVVAQRFLIIIQKQDFSLKNLLLYIIPSCLLVNTHYYGSFFIFINFLFLMAHSIYKKTFSWKNIMLFFTGSFIIALSLLPYFIFTALQQALLNSNFNTWISKPGLRWMLIAALTPLLGILYIYLRKMLLSKKMTETNICFLDYSVFMTSVLYLAVFGISMFRPILVTRYFIILLPLIISVIAMLIVNMASGNSGLLKVLCTGFAILWIIGEYEAIPGGSSGIDHEAIAFISKDAGANPQKTSVFVEDPTLDEINYFKLYGYKPLPIYDSKNIYDTLYFYNISPQEMFSKTDIPDTDRNKLLQIKINNSSVVYKIYSGSAE
jgi:hypothetical protein